MLQRDLLRAIRKDLGQFDRKLDDIDEHFDSALVPKK